MTSLSVEPKIRALDVAERERAVSVLELAFSTDPVMRWMYPDAADYLAHFPAFGTAFAGSSFACGTAFATEDFDGVACWLPVGVAPDGERIEAVIRATIGEERLAAAGPTLEQMEALHPEDPHWYLPIIGVDPSRQGRGIGAALLRHALALSDAEGVPAYLESSNPANQSLYRRHGFEATGEIRSADMPVITPMFRPARG